MSETAKNKFKSGYVAIIGQPNVGKSTLLNNFLHFKISSVTRKQQTTRHQVTGILNGDNYQIIFLDTPGLLNPRYKLQEAMLQTAYRSLQEADLTLYMVTAASKPDDKDLQQLQKISKLTQNIFLIINKMDCIVKDRVLPLIDTYRNFETIKSIIPVSALKQDGLDDLKNEIVDALPVGFPFYDPEQITNHPERFIVSELIREKVFMHYSDEIPYATTVTVDDFVERGKKKDYIKATIYVEKNSQKKILIGKNGSALKRVGRDARQEIEKVLERQIFLELWVKVKEKWRQDEKLLREFGYFKS